MPLGARLRREEGFALPLALSMMAIVGMLSAVTISFATHNTDRATRDALAARAFGAADAGIDAALYRMNKAVTAAQVDGLLGLPAAALAEAKCLSLSVGSVQLLDPVDGWCQATSGAEAVDGPDGSGQSWRGASFTYTASIGVNVGPPPNDPNASLIERRIVSVGTAGDVQKRVIATAHAQLGSNGNLLKVFEQVGYEQCTSAAPSGVAPDHGC